MRVAITGATGFIGRRLTEVLLARGAEVVAFSRGVARASRVLPNGVQVVAWDPLAGPPPAAAFEGVSGVVNLAGESIGQVPWTPERKRRIRESRVVGTTHLVEGLAALGPRPGVLVSGSGVDYYGDRGDERLTEASSAGRGFLAEVCADWEAAAEAATELGMRVVRLRSGLVYGPQGGILQTMLPPFRLGLGAVFGSGRQWMPWIHLEDEVGLILQALEREEVRGPLNAVAPGLVTNAQFTRTLNAVLRRPSLFWVPALALRLALGESAQLLLDSRRVYSERALALGYQFVYPDLRPALEQALGR